jgi:flagellar biosynthetic protein FliP
MSNKIKIMPLLLIVLFLLFPYESVSASPLIDLKIGENGDLSSSVDIFIIVTLLSFLPALIISLTVYIKIVMVLSLTRQALGTMTSPPNIVITGISLILTLFIMMPIINVINEVAYQPYKAKEITFMDGLEKASVPLKEFMVNNADEGHIEMFAKVAEVEITTKESVPFLVASAANVTTQVTEALGLAAVLMIAFVVIDLIIGTILMLLGMFMLPPQMISLPVKIIVFLAAGGFEMIFEILIKGVVI